MRERICKNAAEEALFFESDERFLVEASFEILDRYLTFCGIVVTPPTLVSNLEIPFSAKREDLIGFEKSILKNNREVLRDNYMDKDLLYEVLRSYLELNPKIEVKNLEDRITITKLITEENKMRAKCPKGLNLGCSGKIARACDLIKTLRGSGIIKDINFINLR